MWHAVILAGGSGTRFWPESRRNHPKQFLALAGERSLIEETAARCQPLIPPSQLWVATGEKYGELTRACLKEIPVEQILFEPAARNTAPCIALAAIELLERDSEAVMVVLPSDHLIETSSQFQEDLVRALKIVENNREALVLFGIKPTYPATGYGYIEQSARCDDGGFRVKSFREKPDFDTAEAYVAAETFLWNCGIFVWRADTILAALCQHCPEVGLPMEALKGRRTDADWGTRLRETFSGIPSISIDYAVLEKASNVRVIPAGFTWDDLGSWLAWSRHRPADERGNTMAGTVCPVDTKSCIVRTSDDHLVATFGIDDLLIVHTPDATLVANRSDENALRLLLAEVERRGLERFL